MKIFGYDIIFRGLFPWIEIFRDDERVYPKGFTRSEQKEIKRREMENKNKERLNIKYLVLGDQVFCVDPEAPDEGAVGVFFPTPTHPVCPEGILEQNNPM